jgi:ribose/xylose/arabinose/galactoside ABC-type transport system permease subunit
MKEPAGGASSDRGSWFAVFRAPEWGLVVGIAVVLGLIYVLDPTRSFFRWPSPRFLLQNIALYGVLSLGAAIVIIAGGIDLSVGAVAALASIVSAKLVTEWLPGASASAPPVGVIVVAFALTLLLGLGIGLLHALMINQFRLPPFIATLATMAGLRSLAIILSGNQSINVSFRAYRLLGNDPWYTVPLFAALAISASVMMGATVLGRHIYALGGNEMAARLSGLPTQRLKTVAYAISAMLSALGGILFSGKVGQAAGTMGVSYELFAITAAVVGGCSLSGGVGSIRGTVLGLTLIQIIIKGTGLVVRPFTLKLGSVMFRFPQIDSTQVEGLVLGIVIVVAVAFNQRFRARA